MKNKALTAKQVRALDRYTIEKIGIPELVLMENAGMGIFRYIQQRIPDYRRKYFLVLAGAGNNGGDALVLARHLKTQNIKLEVILVGNKKKASQSVRTQLQILKKLRVKVQEYKPKLLEQYLKESDICIDGILGTGFKGDLRESIQNIIYKINQSKAQVLSIDVPSGINANNGQPSPIAVDANWTLTLGAYKKGLFTQSSREYIGKLQLVDIGLPLKIWRQKRK